MADAINRELPARLRSAGLRYDAELIEDMKLAPDAWKSGDLRLEVRDPAKARRVPAKLAPTRGEPEALIEKAEQSGSATDRTFADALREALGGR